MPHKIIIIDPPGGGNLVATDSQIQSTITWTPDHSLSAEEQIARTEKAEKELAKIREMLTA